MSKTQPLEEKIKSIIDSFELPESEHADRAKESAVTLWLPIDHKMKFDLLQCKSRRRFSQLARLALMQIIDKVSEESA
jgi:hypothetical protein